jgi:hypothetical protein
MPDGWEIRNKWAMELLAVKDKGTIAKCWRDLELSGWMSRFKNSDGTMTYQFHIDPDANGGKTIHPRGDKPTYGKTRSGKNPPLINTILSNNTIVNSNTNRDFPFSEFREMCLKIRDDGFKYGTDEFNKLQYRMKILNRWYRHEGNKKYIFSDDEILKLVKFEKMLIDQVKMLDVDKTIVNKKALQKIAVDLFDKMVDKYLQDEWRQEKNELTFGGLYRNYNKYI